MKIHGFRAKLTLAISGLIALFAAFVCIYFPHQQSTTAAEGLESRATSLAGVLANLAVASVIAEDMGGAEQLTEDLQGAGAADPDIANIVVVKPDGSVFASYAVEGAAADTSHVEHAAEKQVGTVSEHLSVSLPFSYEGSVIGSVTVIVSQGSVAAARSESQKAAFLWGTLILLVGVFATGMLVRPWASRINRLVDAADRIASGDLSQTEIGEKSSDELGHLGSSFERMTENLRDAQAEAENERWFKSGQTELAEQMRGELTPEELGRNVITYLAKYVGAQVGTIYICDSSGTATMVASYAFTRRKQVDQVVEKGQGLLGQAILEKEMMVVSDLPDDYLVVQSSLGNTAPRQLLVAPFLLAGRVKGALELGTVTEVTDEQIGFIRAVSESIAIAVNSAQDRKDMRALLERTQEQAEKLKSQEEELRASNEELAEQTNALRASEEELKNQREELQVSNEELAQKTDYLERQKLEIVRQNQDLERAQQELEKNADELRQASKYKSEFLANMSHELRTPLNSLLILSKSLAENEEGNLTAEQKEAAEIIHGGGRDLLVLINDILDLSKVEAGKLDVNFGQVAFTGLIKHLERRFLPLAREKGVEFDVELGSALPEALSTDGQRLQQILTNLLSNAFKFTEQGSVKLEIDLAAAPAGKSGDFVQFVVTDTGIGIPKEKHSAIFEAFQQADGSTSRQYGGSGLGLAICRELAGLLGGSIAMDSEVGVGSKFTLQVPKERQRKTEVSAPAAAAPRPVAPVLVTPAATQAATPASSGQNGRSRPSETSGAITVIDRTSELGDDRDDIEEGDRVVLLIEDDPRFAQILAKFARKRGYKCVVTSRGATGIELASSLMPTAIILDIGLPDIGGMQVLEQLKYNLDTRHIPVHVVSAGDHSGVALNKGAIGYLAKPASTEGLSEAFAKMETLLASDARSVLLVEDDDDARKAMRNLLDAEEVDISEAATGAEAVAALEKGDFDCVVLDLELPDMTGVEVLHRLEGELGIKVPPVIIHTGRDLSKEEHRELRSFTTSIVIKGPHSPERLLDEVSLFLHKVETSLPDSQRRIIQMLHDPEQVLRDRKILLVDDDLRNTFALSGVLKKHGLQVVIADNGKLAIDKLHAEPGIELVLMDIMMPVMDGYEAIRQIRSEDRFKDLPIITLTAKAMAEDRKKSFEAGANDFFTKPVDVDRLLSLMRVWMFEGHA